ncbi:hypothetical protein ABT160_20390 [Streptomyces sp. NPDC001941]|uniref:hypothetical protein n=1 Tax=Streptomyces sp. NPDC001941 TaxID=3154659 RepID=UPI00332BEC17
MTSMSVTSATTSTTSMSATAMDVTSATSAPHRWEPRAWAGCAVAAAGLAVLTDLAPHRIWGWCAATGYAAAALVARRGARAREGVPEGRLLPATPVLLALLGSAVLPLLVLVVLGKGQLEVEVVERSGDLLLSTASPYVEVPRAVAEFNPYLPGMALFGALPGDARWWTGGVFAVTLLMTVRVGAGANGRVGAGASGRPGLVPYVLACPLVALSLAVGGVDLPVAGLLCLGLTLADRRGPGLAGLALGAACALKWTAWPALPVAVALVAVRGGARPALRCALVALVPPLAVVLPVALAHPGSFYANAVAFPLGLTGTTSPAASPLPGYLLATWLPGGRTLALALLAGSALVVGLSLVLRPPATGAAASRRLALGLGLAMCLMPATRFGYLVYPFVLWATTLRPGAVPVAYVRELPGPTARPGRPRLPAPKPIAPRACPPAPERTPA